VGCDCGGGRDTAVVVMTSGSPEAMSSLAGVDPACDCSGHSHPLSTNSSSSSSSSVRKLLQQGSALCPPGCKPGACREVGTAQGGVWCTECINNLLSSKVTGVCTCPPGRYLGPAVSCVGELSVRRAGGGRAQGRGGRKGVATVGDSVIFCSVLVPNLQLPTWTLPVACSQLLR
jgi:hypothetical protein